MNVRQLVGRTVIMIMTDEESLKGTVEPSSTKTCFVLARAVLMEPTGETQVDGLVYVSADKPRWVQVV